MPYNKIVKELGAETMSFKKRPPQKTLPGGDDISKDLNALLTHFKGAIIFSKGAKFKTPQKIPAGDHNGFVYLDIIYGLSPDTNNIFYKNEMYANQINQEFYTFGESGGGDQFCIRKKTEEIYYWYHEATSDDCSLFYIAPSFTVFVENLVPDDENEKNGFEEDDGIISADFDF